MGGDVLDSIEYYTEQVTRMSKVVEDRREELDNEDALPTNYGESFAWGRSYSFGIKLTRVCQIFAQDL